MDQQHIEQGNQFAKVVVVQQIDQSMGGLQAWQRITADIVEVLQCLAHVCENASLLAIGNTGHRAAAVSAESERRQFLDRVDNAAVPLTICCS